MLLEGLIRGDGDALTDGFFHPFPVSSPVFLDPTAVSGHIIDHFLVHGLLNVLSPCRHRMGGMDAKPPTGHAKFAVGVLWTGSRVNNLPCPKLLAAYGK